MKINFGTKEELELVGYVPSRNKKIATVVLCILSFGLLFLLLSWKPSIRLKFTHVICPIGEAKILLVKDTNGEIWEETVEEQDLYHNFKRIIQKYFFNKKIKYIWDKELGTFSRLSYPSPGTRVYELFSEENGITFEQATERKEEHGENFINIETPTVWNLFVSQAYNPFYIFQAYTVIIWCLQTYYIYSVCIFSLSVISITLNIWETRRQTKVLREKMTTESKVQVLRSGKIHVLDSKELVPGDVVMIVTGTELLEADMLLLEGSTIMNEAILTGESLPVTKVHLQRNDGDPLDPLQHKCHMLHCGTQVLQVRGGNQVKALVTQTGYDTVKGEMIRSILFPKPMNLHIYSDFLRLIFIFLCLGLIAMTWSLVNWSMKDNVDTATVIFNSLDLLTFVVPPIIPATITAINLWGQRRLQARKIFCLSSNYISLAGPVDVVCFDKTGTLTDDDMSVVGVVPSANAEFAPPIKNLKELPCTSKLAQALGTCHSVAKDVMGMLIGHPLDVKIFNAIGWKLLDIPEEGGEGEEPLFVVEKAELNDLCYYSVYKSYPFESSAQRMTVIAKRGSSAVFDVFMKGAPEKIFSLCFKETVPSVFQDILDWYTRQGLRIIAAAYKTLPTSMTLKEINNTERDFLEQDSEFLGLVILQNRLKPETSPALQTIHQASIATVMITGDSLLTATSVARQCGLVGRNQQVIFVEAEYVPSSSKGPQHIIIHYKDSDDSSDIITKGVLRSVVNPNYVFGIDGVSYKLISEYDKETCRKIAHRGKIFARMKPDQKIDIIEALQQLGHQVAMCGDGCNDCGALKAAHAGISLSSTEASVAAPFTSLQQDISCVTTLILEGRATLISTYVSFKYNIAYCFAALTVVLFTFSIYTEPTDIQYLIMDLVLITVPSLVMGNTAASEHLCEQRPSRRVVHPLHITSIISFLGLQTLMYWLTWQYLEAQSWFEPFILLSTEFVQDPGYESTVIIMQSFFTFTIGAIVFSHSLPFRKPFYTNKILTAYLIFSSILCIIFAFCQVDWLYYTISFKPFPYGGFTWTIFFSVILTGLICYIWERFFLYGVVENWFIPKFMVWMGPTRPFQHLEIALKEDTKWPKLDSDDYPDLNGKNTWTPRAVDLHISDSPLGFYRKSSMKRRFTAEVVYVDELEPLQNAHQVLTEMEDVVDQAQHNQRYSQTNDSTDHFYPSLETQSLEIEELPELDTEIIENEPSSSNDHGESTGTISSFKSAPDQMPQPEAVALLRKGSDVKFRDGNLVKNSPLSDSDQSGINLIKEMNTGWARVRNSIHESFKDFNI